MSNDAALFFCAVKDRWSKHLFTDGMPITFMLPVTFLFPNVLLQDEIVKRFFSLNPLFPANGECWSTQIS